MPSFLKFAALGVALAITAAIGTTLWATEKSRERTECYKAAAQVSDCQQPGAVESAVRAVLG